MLANYYLYQFHLSSFLVSTHHQVLTYLCFHYLQSSTHHQASTYHCLWPPPIISFWLSPIISLWPPPIISMVSTHYHSMASTHHQSMVSTHYQSMASIHHHSMASTHHQFLAFTHHQSLASTHQSFVVSVICHWLFLTIHYTPRFRELLTFHPPCHPCHDNTQLILFDISCYMRLVADATKRTNSAKLYYDSSWSAVQ